MHSIKKKGAGVQRMSQLFENNIWCIFNIKYEKFIRVIKEIATEFSRALVRYHKYSTFVYKYYLFCVCKPFLLTALLPLQFIAF